MSDTQIHSDVAAADLPARYVELPQGRIRVREAGEGAAVVFVHGLLVNGDLWRKVAPELVGNARVIVPDLPLGSHPEAMHHDADLSVPGLARLLVELLDALGIERATFVGNDTGGALTQVLATTYPDRVDGMVLTSCDAFENFPPPLFRPLLQLARSPALLLGALKPLSKRPARKLPVAYGWLAKNGIPDDVTDGYLKPFLEDAGVRHDCCKVLRGVSPEYTQAAAKKLPGLEMPVLIVWSGQDRFFPPEHGRRLARLCPNGRYLEIDGSYTFSSEDNPKQLVDCLREFLEHRGTQAATAA